jgi:hypothetical protein
MTQQPFQRLQREIEPITQQSANTMSINDLKSKIDQLDTMKDRIAMKLMSGELNNDLDLKRKLRKLNTNALKKTNILRMVLMKKESQQESQLKKDRKIFLSNLQQKYNTLNNLTSQEKLKQLKAISRQLQNNSNYYDRNINSFSTKIADDISKINNQNLRLESQRRNLQRLQLKNKIDMKRSTDKSTIQEFRSKTKSIESYINNKNRQIMLLSDYNKMLELNQDIKTNKSNLQALISDIKNDSKYKDLLVNPPRTTFLWNTVRKTIDEFPEKYQAMQTLFNTKKKVIQLKNNRSSSQST